MLKRAFLSKLRNRANLLTTLLEAPVLALLISMVLRYSEEDHYTFASAFHIPTYLFLSLVVAMFLGLTNSADEIIRDRHMLNRERNHNLRVSYYICGKIISLAAFALMQCVIYLLDRERHPRNPGDVLHPSRLDVSHLAHRRLLGLLVSSFVHDSRTALNIIPLILIPQIILGGALIKYEEMNRNLDFVYSIRRWVANKGGDDSSAASKLKVPFICQFMPLRWSYESVIISQAKLNPLTRNQELLENRIQSLIPPAGQADDPGAAPGTRSRQTGAGRRLRTSGQRSRRHHAPPPPHPGRHRIGQSRSGTSRSPEGAPQRQRRGNLREPQGARPRHQGGDGARGLPAHVESQCLLRHRENLPVGQTGGASENKLAARRSAPKPWYQEFRIETLTLNATVMILWLVLVIGALAVRPALAVVAGVREPPPYLEASRLAALRVDVSGGGCKRAAPRAPSISLQQSSQKPV